MKQLIGLIYVIVCLQALSVQAQQHPSDPAQLNILQQIQQCVASIDRDEIQRLEKKATDLYSAISPLCEAGKDLEAKDRARQFSEELMQSAVIKELKKCSESLQGLIPELPFEEFIEDFSSMKICDIEI
jgi:hypothetical protein